MFLSDEEKAILYNNFKRKYVANCKRCGGTGTVPITDNKYQIYKKCVCRKHVDRDVRLLDGGFPRYFLSDEWTLKVLENKSYYNKIKSYVEDFDGTQGLYIHGGPGRGKTTVVCIVAKKLMMRKNELTGKNYTIGFTEFGEVINRRLSSSYIDKDICQWLINVPDILILDKLGMEMGRDSKGQMAQRVFAELMSARVNAMKVTFITSEFTPKEMETEYGLGTKNLVFQNCRDICLIDENHRNPQSERDEINWD